MTHTISIHFLSGCERERGAARRRGPRTVLARVTRDALVILVPASRGRQNLLGLAWAGFPQPGARPPANHPCLAAISGQESTCPVTLCFEKLVLLPPCSVSWGQRVG